MLESVPVSLVVGTILGFLSGIGVGGGSLLILWLTLVLHMPPSAARGINLAFFLPAALVSSLFRWKQRKLRLSVVIPGAVSGCVAAAFFTWLGLRVDVDILKKGFGALLLVTGVRELFYRTKR